MTMVRAGRGKVPPICAEVADLAALPAGPQLLAQLTLIDESLLTGRELVLYLAAWNRQLAYTQGQLAGAVAATMAREDPSFGVAYDPDDLGGDRFDWAGIAEVKAALVVSKQRADTLCGLVAHLAVHLPMVFTAWQRGLVDQSRADAFVRFTFGLSVAQQQVIATRLLPTAASKVLGRLVADIVELGIELDPAHAERMRKRVRQNRAVHIGVNKTTGTGDLFVQDADAEVLIAVSERLDAIGWATKREALARKLDCRLDNIRADLATHVLAGLVPNDDEHAMVDYLLTLIETDNTRATQQAAQQAAKEAAEAAKATEAEAAAEAEQATAEQAAPGQEAAEQAGAGQDGAPAAPEAGAEPAAPGVAPEPVAAQRGGKRWQLANLIQGRGLTVRLRLSTLMGLDDHAGVLIGTGPQLASICRRLATAPHAIWRVVVVDAAGVARHVETLTTRPSVAISDGDGPGEGAGYRGVEIQLTLTPDDLLTLGTTPPAGWESVLVEVAGLAAKPALPPGGDDRDRFPTTRLRRLVETRDQTCRGINCLVPAARCECDHTIDYARGGLTVLINLGMLCRRCHSHKDYAWTLIQREDGVFEWISPLGAHYRAGPPEALDISPVPYGVEEPEDPGLPGWVPDRGWQHDTCLTTYTPPPEPPPKPPKNKNKSKKKRADEPPPAADEQPPF